MRLALFLLLGCSLLCGCKSAGKKPEAEQKPRRTATARVMNGPSNERPSVRPVEAIRGRIIAVRPQLRFVIADFTNNKLPRLDQHLFVYRLDQKVAEIKISGPYLGTTVAADITAGDVQEGDLVREQ